MWPVYVLTHVMNWAKLKPNIVLTASLSMAGFNWAETKKAATDGGGEGGGMGVKGLAKFV